MVLFTDSRELCSPNMAKLQKKLARTERPERRQRTSVSSVPPSPATKSRPKMSCWGCQMGHLKSIPEHPSKIACEISRPSIDFASEIFAVDQQPPTKRKNTNWKTETPPDQLQCSQRIRILQASRDPLCAESLATTVGAETPWESCRCKTSFLEIS